MRRAATILSSAAALASAGAAVATAADWTTRGTFSQGFTARIVASDENDGGGDPSLRLNSRLGLVTTGRNATTTWTLSPNLTFQSRPDTPEDEGVVTPSVAFSGSVAHTQPRYGLNASLSITPQFVSDREFETLFTFDPETGLIELTNEDREIDPLQITIVGRAGASMRVSDASSLSLSGFVRVREYDETSERLQPTRTFGSTLGWSRSLSARTSISASSSVTRFTSAAADDEPTMSWRGSTGVSRRLTSRHSASTNLGLTATDNGEEVALTFSGGGSFSYATRQGGVSLGLSQQVAQRDSGEVAAVIQLRADARRPINEVSSLSFGLRASRVNPLFPEEDDGDEEGLILTFAPRYQLRLTEAWRLTASYGVSTDIENGGGIENRLFVSLSRSFEVFD